MGLRGVLRVSCGFLGESPRRITLRMPAEKPAACGTGGSVARRRALGSRSPASFGAFALLDGPGLTQFRG